MLILSEDTVITALLLSLLELEGFTLRYPRRNEAPAVAIARLTPHVILVDCDHAAAALDAFYDAAAEAGAAVVVFSPQRARAEVEMAAVQRGLRWFTLPIGRTRLRQLVFDALSDITQGAD